ncbi:chitobiase/beta-hexosaminidase C-terminal domain-containing protein [Paenibacillus polysaccharolyticus]|uniref:non-contractile tail sheath protein n=1 Tax=Paenibacillus polysaccharolyticus TaxID=582692 RepID=UPI0020A0723B|nr:chitobiase/beta-hexosaminidase C-terminal domain-containing protein [Paenibacillus polysaccharolyticus]
MISKKVALCIAFILSFQLVFIGSYVSFAEESVSNEQEIQDLKENNEILRAKETVHDDSEIQDISDSYAVQLKKWKQEFPDYEPQNAPKNKSLLQSKLAVSSKTSSTHDNEVYKLQPKYLTNNFSFSMMASTITNGNTVTTMGNFRKPSDLSGMSWESIDHYSHPDLKYPTDSNFSDVTLSYTYNLYGNVPDMNSTLAPALTIETNAGEIYYARLWNYVTNRPQDDWEQENNIIFPAGRTAGVATGTQGNIKIDFNNLYAGWQPYQKEYKVITDKDGKKEYLEEWVKNPEWRKIPVNDIKKIMWAYVPTQYDGTAANEYLNDSEKFMVKMTNWNVSGNDYLGEEPKTRPAQALRITDDYDDIYNLTPERVVSDYQKLGFNGYVTMYVGASHYYDKKYLNGAMEVITDYPFNSGFEQWYDNYIKRLSEHDFKLINSISMESVDAPADWWQRTWDNTPATSGWVPVPHLLSFTNPEVQKFYKKYVLELARMSVKNGMEPMIQEGEPWWWFMEGLKDKPPTFYDKATKDLYQKETGKRMYEFKSSLESIKGHEDMLYWLRNKNGEFTLMLRDAVKKVYPDAKFTVLFFTPSVVDRDRVPQMMSIVNFPYKQWKYPNLDFFMLEDYDYLIYDQKDKHIKSLTYVQSHLKYPVELIHYFAGFVNDIEHLGVWDNINQAINDGFNQGFGEVYVWAYAQVKRDGWTLPDLIKVNKPTGLYEKPFNLTLSTTADKIVYTSDGSKPTLTHGTVYTTPIHISGSTDINAAVIKNGQITQIYNFTYDIGIKKYEYDAFNRIISERIAKDDKLYIIDYIFDALGNMIKQDRMIIDNK